jgi:hypothetical protein
MQEAGGGQRCSDKKFLRLLTEDLPAGEHIKGSKGQLGEIDVF